jgi:hypothetical protein
MGVVCWVILLANHGHCLALGSLWLGFTEPRGAAVARATALVLFLGFGCLGGYCLLWAGKGSVVLTADQMEIRGPFRRRIVKMEEVRGWRILSTSPPTLLLSLMGQRSRTVKVSLLFPLDEAFAAWLTKVPDLDDHEAAKSASELAEDPSLGATKVARAATLGKARRQCKLLNGVAMVVSVWAWFYPHPYVPLMVVLVALPWVALVIAGLSNGLVRCDELKNDAHPNVAVSIIFPALILMVRAVLDYDVLESASVVALCVGAFVVLILGVVFADPTILKRKSSAIGFAVLALSYGYGSIMELNGLKDRGVPITYSAHVESKHISSGKTTNYEVRVGPWGTQTKGGEIDVGRDAYGLVEVGSNVPVTVRHGWLGVDWYYVER